MLGGFSSRTDTDDFFPDTFKNLNHFVNKVPFLTGMNSTESGCMFMVFADHMSPGINDGWTEEQIIDNYKKGIEAMTPFLGELTGYFVTPKFLHFSHQNFYFFTRKILLF